MILYYTGTGNSRYAAKRISRNIGDTCQDLFEWLRDGDFSEICSQLPFVIVSPTYGWQLPHILRDWMGKAKLTGCRDIYFVLTCGSEVGNAEKYLLRLCESIGMNYKGCAEIVMPENYIALFHAPERKEALEIIERAEPVIDRVSDIIAERRQIPEKAASVADRLKSGPVNALYYPLMVRSKKFYTKDSCTGCGKCANMCVMGNIRMAKGRPVWGNQCTHCMACICGCPAGAVEYGNASEGKPRYQCPKNVS